MGVYLLVIGEISLLSFIQNRLRNTYLMVITLSLILLVGLRPLLLGTDTGSYVDLFNGIVNGRYWDSSLSNLFSGRFEIGFLDFVKLSADFTDNPRFLLLSSAVVMYVPLAIYIKKESLNPTLSFLIFFTLTYFPQSMSAMRESMAVGFLMLAVVSLNNSYRWWPPFVWIFIAFLFHRSAILFLLVLVLKRYRFTAKKATVAVVGSMLVALSFTKIFTFILKYIPSYSYYSNNVGALSVKTALIMNIALSLLLLIVASMDKSHEESVNTNRWMLLLAICVYTISFVFNGFDRMAMVFLFAQIILVPNAIAKLQDEQLRKLLNVLLGAICVLYFVVVLIYRPDWLKITPYFM
ncbi:EpsG family protein [Fructobacillus evanidus]|uniref:EpsG family protein n=2 Tax=Fructobacillus evanidus TaxID=3064281 RepID=A0ABN9YLD8_9LACO|nr:hypothetical protein R55250_KEHBDPNM_00298 [Fructobacillus sp. LMG 32999]CAK1223652.1 hypothetical protein R55203_MFJFHIJN_00007 [Fructobacillus sp. LMG 32999]CAK1223736.1 hypothetical protein R55214_HHFBAMCI_00008 [Fructobacillus sp. LMG 32999]CAK1230958.1 hypothetical protein R55234_GCHJJDIB_00298 [Fructobacillus sp. LMG 32999]CAK1250780.1 hypothetical protein R53718_MFFEMHAI_01659 [Fructobacillus sp. LMG 32999]